MRVPRRSGFLLAVVASVAVALPAVVTAALSEDLVKLTQGSPYLQDCVVTATDATCTGPVSRIHIWDAFIAPASRQFDTLRTDAVEYLGQALDVESRDWMVALHSMACVDSKGVLAFVDDVAALTKVPSSIGRIVGECTMTGRIDINANGRYLHQVVSRFTPPSSPPPTPTAAPTTPPTPTAPPTATPKVTPRPTATPAPSAPVVPDGTDAPSVAPSASAEPSATPSLAPATPIPSPTPSPTAIVAPGATGPAPTEPAGGVGGSGGSGSAPSLPTFSQSVLDLTDVNTEGGAVGGNLLLALLLLLIIGFAGELFNNTVENNYAEISGWFGKGPLGWLRRMGGALGGQARVGLLGFLALTAFISSFVDPHLGFDLRSLGEFLGFLVGLVVVLASFKLPPMLAHKRKTGDLGRLRPLPWALAIAALFVLVSRVGNLQPGYLYGIVLGAIFVRDVPKREEGRQTFYGSLWTLAAAALAWLGLTWVRSLGYDPNGFGITLLSTAFAAILVAGLEATAFGLMPLRFMPGHAVYTWNRLGWGLLFGLSIFAFIHLLISPTSGYVSQLSPQAFIAACGVFAAFGAVSIVTWGYFRFRPRPA